MSLVYGCTNKRRTRQVLSFPRLLTKAGEGRSRTWPDNGKDKAMADHDTATEDELFQFIEEYASKDCRAELLMFWGRHPDTKFSKLAICLHCTGTDACDALDELVKSGLLDKNIRNDTAIYSLTTKPEIRRSVIALTRYQRPHLYLIRNYLKERRRPSYTV